MTASAIRSLSVRALQMRCRPHLIRLAPTAGLAAILAVAAFLRFWRLDSIGFNSDEAVYTGTATSISGDQSMRDVFPVFRAHPVLLQTLVALTGHGHRPTDWAARAVPAGIGVLTVLVTYLLGRSLYRRTVGLLAALLVAVMPYHVTSSRQVLLDGLMTLCGTLVLYCMARYVQSPTVCWLMAAGAMLGLTVLAKETGLVFLGAGYAFLALTAELRLRPGHILTALGAMGMVVAAYPCSLALTGRGGSGQHYLLWQLVRRANHEAMFYFRVVPPALGWWVVCTAVLGLVILRREHTWRERMLVCWIAVPLGFFTLWPVKGYQYLLPIAPAVAVLSARTLVRSADPATLPRPLWAVPRWLARWQSLAPGWLTRHGGAGRWFVPSPLRRRWVPTTVAVAASAAAVITTVTPAWAQVHPSPGMSFMAGTGGLPCGREAGHWVRRNVPDGAELLAIGPSVANVLTYYGQRRVRALSVNPNPSRRNPAYQPVPNPDRALRDGEFQYIVWDAYTAARSAWFADQARRLIDRYHGVVRYTGTVTVGQGRDRSVVRPVIIIYQVHL